MEKGLKKNEDVSVQRESVSVEEHNGENKSRERWLRPTLFLCF